MQKEKRRSPRRPFERQAWVEVEDERPAIACVLVDLSATGARIEIAPSEEIPPEFVLRFSRNGQVARKCRIAWRLGSSMGLDFMARRVNGAP